LHIKIPLEVTSLRLLAFIMELSLELALVKSRFYHTLWALLIQVLLEKRCRLWELRSGKMAKEIGLLAKRATGIRQGSRL
jgi:hypothetical protein